MTVAFGSAGAETLSATNISIASPAGVALGDTLVAFIENDGAGTPARSGWAIPTGASMVTNGTNLFVALMKVADSGDVTISSTAGTFDFTGTSVFTDGVVLCYPGGDTTTPVNVAGHNTANSNVSPPLTTTAANCMEVACLNSDGGVSSTAAAAGWTRRVDGAGHNLWVGERFAASAGATSATSIVAAGTGQWGVISIALNSPLSAAVPDAPAAPNVRAQHHAIEAWLDVAPTNNGAAITDYIWEYALSPYTSWSTFSDGTSTSLTVPYITGLTSGTSYKVRATATNSVGNSTAGTASAAITVLDLTGILIEEAGNGLTDEAGNALRTEV